MSVFTQAAKETIADYDRVMASMGGCEDCPAMQFDICHSSCLDGWMRLFLLRSGLRFEADLYPEDTGLEYRETFLDAAVILLSFFRLAYNLGGDPSTLEVEDDDGAIKKVPLYVPIRRSLQRTLQRERWEVK